jgi:GNAT superfamily N-acetyltransferase
MKPSDPILDEVHRNILKAGHRVVHESVPSARAVEKYAWLLIDAGRPSMPFLNGAAPMESADVSTIEDVENWFKQRNSPALFRLRSGVDAPLIHALERSGYAVTRTEPILHMAAPVPPTIETPLCIVEVQTTDQRNDIMVKVFPDGWTDDFAAGMSRATVTMANTAELWGLHDGRLVAGAIVVVTSSMAGIYAVSVEEEFRRRGYGTAITWAAIEAGQRLGANSVWLGSTEMALPMYLNMGFRQIGEYQMLARPQS